MSQNRFAGKTALVTGGNSGMGLAVAQAFAGEGAQVIITGRNQETLTQAAATIGGKTLAIKSDASRVQDIERTMRDIAEHVGKIDVLFANAGIAQFAPIDAVTEESWDAMVDTNLKGLYFTIQKALPLMGKGSAIVLNASVVAGKGNANTSVYAATKAAVRSLGRTLAADLVARGIRVNVVSPGPIETPIWARPDGGVADVDGTKAHLAAGNPMKRLGTVDEIAAAVLFLASPEASYITGVDLLVDGGEGSL